MTPEEFAAEWERCAGWLGAALRRDPTHTIDQVRTLCETRPASYQFWPGERAALVSQVIDQPEFREFHLWLAGGDLIELMAGYASIEAFAIAAGCTRITAFVRPGFVKPLAPLGYRPQFVAVVKDLTP